MAALRAALRALFAAPRARSPPLGRRPPPAPRSASAAARGAAMEPAPRWLAGLRFDNRALRALPVETPPPGPEGAPSAPRPVPGACFSRVRPAPLRQPRLVALSEPALALLGLGAPPADAAAREAREAEAALFFSGNALLPGAEPAAHCYCGHQFGQFAGQLGDGAAMYLGEVCTAAGERWELQLKGAGPTPFSRQADGRKVLRSSIREFLCSEAMFHLGIPTTRAGACVTSQSTVVRDVFYDGNPKYEKCTVVLRIASTFLRFGSFEIFKPADEHTGREGPSVGRNDIRVQMLDYVIGTFYPEIQATHAEDRVQRNAAFFREVTRRTAWMVAEWQCVGFCHGVLNTDNMSIVGLTIDYGPFGFLDRYDPDHVCNASDNAGRYTYSKQPEVCKWNLQKLLEALEPELPRELGEAILAEEFDSEFHRHYLQKMRRKLGLVRKELDDDGALVAKLLETMHLTAFLNSLPSVVVGDSSSEQIKTSSVAEPVHPGPGGASSPLGVCWPSGRSIHYPKWGAAASCALRAPCRSSFHVTNICFVCLALAWPVHLSHLDEWTVRCYSPGGAWSPAEALCLMVAGLAQLCRFPAVWDSFSVLSLWTR
uniref:protein adenylyltransferase SelO, mitochondrial isoform X2 n=1 Tax=Nyctereutes procyonoides TaxID=34880 RepID=UPI0024441287|nr:protein adenylyltransferase SelO, mitochondrial isoform X2 [Nyctereutes procyonoides]